MSVERLENTEPRTYTAVSYTHLDVYKRQGMDRLKSIGQFRQGIMLCDLTDSCIAGKKANAVLIGLLKEGLQDVYKRQG